MFPNEGGDFQFDFFSMNQLRANLETSILRRAVEFWPYAFIVVSVTGLTYIVLSAIR